MFSMLLTPSKRQSLPLQPLHLPQSPSPDTRLPQHSASQHHEPHTPQWEDQSGRLAINSARTGYEPNVAGNLTALTHHSTNTISRRHSLRSQTSTDNAPTITLSTSHSRAPHREGPASPLQQQRPEESDARASDFETADTPPTSP